MWVGYLVVGEYNRYGYVKGGSNWDLVLRLRVMRL